MKKVLYLSFLLLLSQSQFTSFVPSYSVEQPQSYEYGSFPFINPFDPYSLTSDPPLSEKKRLRYDQDSREFQTSKNSESHGFGFGSNVEVKDDNRCRKPKEWIRGKCRCPDNGVFLSGSCYPRTSDVFCYYPLVLENGRCKCPNNQIYTREGYCIARKKTVYEQNGPCQKPKQLHHGFCVCPKNSILVSGQCFIPDDQVYFPTEHIGPISDPNSICGLASINRNYDGANNNLNNRLWGSKGSLLERRSFAAYADGTSEPVKNRPNARAISNAVGEVVGAFERSRDHITMAFVIWGQFLDHDIDLTTQGQSEAFHIEIPLGDKFFSQQYMDFHRSHFAEGTSPRQHRNSITAWIDGSQVYGSDETTARFLRDFKLGKMRVSHGDLLPTNNNQRGQLFEAGDIRANENILLLSYHTIFVREHNRLCDEIRLKDSSLNDEQMYQAARHYVIGLLQKITMEDFLPLLLGDEYYQIIGPYHGYKPYINPNIPTQFSTGAFRIGHTLLVDIFLMMNQYGHQIGEFSLKDLFFRPNFLNSDNIQSLIRGLSVNVMKEKSIQLVDSVRNLLVLDPDNRQIKLDLYSLNIQRGRDHGLPGFNEVRAAFGLSRLTSFYQLVSDPKVAWKLEKLYSTIDDLDLIVGIFAEDHVPNGVLGQLGAKIVGETFRNLRDGDRFWYQFAYPDKVVWQIKETTFSEIIKRNTNIGSLQKDIFRRYG